VESLRIKDSAAGLDRNEDAVKTSVFEEPGNSGNNMV